MYYINVFMYYLCEKYYKPITVQNYIAIVLVEYLNSFVCRGLALRKVCREFLHKHRSRHGKKDL